MSTLHATLFGGWGARLFQVAAAFAHARRTRRRLRLTYRDNAAYGSRNHEAVFERFTAPLDPPRLLPERAAFPDEALRALAEHEGVDAATIELVSDEPAAGAAPAAHLSRLPLPNPRDRDLLLHGRWQHEDYFRAVAPELRRLLAPPPYVRMALAALPPGELTDATVAVHVRMGDFRWNAQGVDLTLYYARAMDAVREAMPRARFVLVSDEADAAAAAYPAVAARCAARCRFDAAFDDELFSFYYMARCAGVVCACSAFSWWAAWLNPRPDKLVTLPTPWPPSAASTLSMAGAREVPWS